MPNDKLETAAIGQFLPSSAVAPTAPTASQEVLDEPVGFYSDAGRLRPVLFGINATMSG